MIMPPIPGTNLGFVNSNGFKKMAAFTLGPNTSDCADLTPFTTQTARDGLKIPDSISGTQWAVIDEQGEVMSAGNIGQAPITLGGQFFGCKGNVAFTDFQPEDFAVFGSTSGGSSSGSSSSGSASSGGSSSGSGSGSSGSSQNGFTTGPYYAIHYIFGYDTTTPDSPCECPCTPPPPPPPPFPMGDNNPGSWPGTRQLFSTPAAPAASAEAAYSTAPIRFTDGKIMHSVTDISSGAGGISWGHARSYDNITYSAKDMRNGKRWMIDSLPYVNFYTLYTGSEDQEMVSIRLDAGRTAYFKVNADETVFTPHGNETSVLKHNVTDKTYELRTNDGALWFFHDYSDANRQRGCLKSITIPGGAVLEMLYNSDKSPDKVRKTFVDGGVTKMEELVYSYVSCDDGFNRIQYVTLRNSSNNGVSWVNLKRVFYSYYGNSDNNGTAGDLKMVTSQIANGNAWVDLGSMYYRYYKDGQQKGFKHALKYIFEWADYASLAAAGTPASMTDVQVAAYASNYFEYRYAQHHFYSSYMQYQEASLEKTKGGTQTYNLTYSTSIANTNPNYWWKKTVESFTNGASKTVYTNFEGKPVLTVESAPGKTAVVNHYVYDTQGRLIQHNTPNSIISYQDNSGDGNYGYYHSYTYVPAVSTTLKTNDGLIKKYEYYNNVSGQPNGYLFRETIQKGSTGTPIKVKEVEYTSQAVKNAQNQTVQTLWMISRSTQYAAENGTDPVTVQYSYVFQGSTSKLSQKTTTVPAVSTSKNGAGTTANRVECYDDHGRVIWSKDELGIIAHFKYDQTQGTLLRTIVDVDTTKTSDFGTSVPSGWATASGAGKHLVTDMEYDAYRRMIQTLEPKNTTINSSNQSIETRRASWIVYDDVNYTTRSASGYVTLNSSGTVTGYTLNNPVSIVKKDVSGKVLEQIQAKRASTSGKLLATDAFAQSSYVAWSKNIYSTQGRLTATRQYFLIPASGDGVKDTNYHETTFAYDAMGRKNRVVSPDGTITRTVYDWRDNPIQAWVGTSDTNATDTNPRGTGNMVIVSETEFGGSSGCSSCSASHDQPRVNIQYVDSTRTRVMEFGYDYRGRQTHVYGEDDADGNMTYTVNTHDNVNRVTKSERFLLVPNNGSGSSGGTSGSGSLGSGSGTDGSGNPKIDTNDPSDDRLLTRSEQFYDERGRNWKTVQSVVNPANGTVTGKMQSLTWFDAAGRVIKSQGMGENHFTKNVYDSLSRVVKSYVTTNPADTTYATASVITGDTVHQQSEVTYDNAGNVILAASVERMVSQVGTGELKIAAAPKGRYQFIASWFDPMGRQIAAANYGTNNDTALTRPATVPARSDNVLVTETFYDADTGRDWRTVDPAGKDHRAFFDAMGRTTKTVANYTGTGAISSTTPDQNVTVEMTYHSSGQVATMTAKNPTTGDQVTRYVYGTSKTSIVPVIYRNDVLACEIYPDSDDLENSSGVLQNGPDGIADRMEFQYNRIGERIQRKDQNGTIHAYDFDNLGRLLHDRVTTLGTGVDGAVRRISTAYDVVGNVKSVTSYNNATVGTGTVVNEVKYELDTNGLLAKEYQDPSGAATTASLYVGYTYDVTKSGDLFTKRLRPTSLRYPSATMINYTYGTAGSVDDLLNRFKTVQNGSTNIVDYTDMGLATPAVMKYPVPNLTLDYTAVGALDRFNRITDHAWKNASGTALVQIKHGYDRVGNRLYREDVAATGAGKSFDELYAYDGMNQLIDMQRGKLNTTKNGLTTKNAQDNFAFDATGNWTTYKQDATGAGFTLTQAKTHNKANEIATIAGASTYTASDANGNMTKCVKPNNWSAAFTLVYDAWNRLVIVKDSETIVATYCYDGLNRRVKKVVGSETRLFYFNRGWQCVEEYVGSTCDTRYVWGLRYIDDLVTYRKGSTDYYSVADPNWNVVALTNTAGVVQERYNYAAFGKVNIFDAVFAVRATSSCSITRTFTGQVLDTETGLMLYRNRIYHPTLGRFIQRDPIGYEGDDVNLYRYVNSSPIIYFDSEGTVNSKEIKYCIGGLSPARYACCLRANHISREIRKKARDRYGELQDDTALNAVYHCVWQCKIASSSACGERRAKRIGDNHEYGDEKNTHDKEKMDLCNNDVGRQVSKGSNGTWEGCFSACEEKLKDCQLCWFRPVNTDNFNKCGKTIFSDLPPQCPAEGWDYKGDAINHPALYIMYL